jgi:glyoxylase-like metal-dependent hydrolase (beta-lactamase superfamily II)
MTVEIRDVAPGLWLWRQPHWEWREGDDWEPEVSSFVVESDGEVVLLDPLAPPPSARDVWDRIEAKPPTRVVILKPDHVRDLDLFVHWYQIPAHGPWLFWPGDVPKTQLTPLRAGQVAPGGLQALDDGRGSMETPVYLRQQRVIVFADGMTAPGGVLRPWWSPVGERMLAALRAMLGLPFEHVLVSHGEPVHSRAEFEAALEREPWSKPDRE